jgi:branched-chain amino acid transport system permease protein
VTLLLQLLVGGLSLGAVYALLALGFVVVYRSSGVVNFAHPALLMIGAYTIARVAASDLPFAVAVLAGVGAAGLVAFVVQRLLVYPMAGRSVIAVSILTIGVDVITQTEIIRRIGLDGYVAMNDPWADHVVRIGAVVVPQTRLVALALCAGIIGAFFAWFRYSRWGVAMRAVADDPETAALMGVRRVTVTALAWTLAGVLAAVAGLFLTVFPSPGLQPATAAVALRAFPAAIIGGLDSTGGAIVGGLVVGVAEVLAQGYATDLSFLGAGFHTVMPYAVMVAVLLVRPTGLFGTRELHRV